MKTIFFCLSGRDTYRSFFFFPDCLFDRLEAAMAGNADLKVVIIVQPKHLEYFSGLLASRLNERVIIEAVPVAAERGWRKIFSFFYSYLIYTGTTRTLATMGMRPDDAPGGGKRIMAPLKYLIANTFGRFQFIKLRLVPWIYQRILRQKSFDHLFEKYRPQLAFIPNVFTVFDRHCLSASKFWKVRTIGMVANWDHFDKYFLPLHVDKVLVQSEQIKRFTRKYQFYKEEEIRIIGYPHIDFVVDSRYARERQEVLKDLGFPAEARYILYISGSMYYPDEPDIIETMLKWIDQGKLGPAARMVIRPYPGGRGKDRDFDEKKFNSFKDHPHVSFYAEPFWEDLEKSKYFMNVLRQADAVIAVYSTACLEALAVDRPVLTTAFDGYKTRPFHRSVRRFEMREHFRDIIDLGGMRRTTSFDDLLQALQGYLANPSQDAGAREQLRQYALYRTDGQASQRILENILSEIKL